MISTITSPSNILQTLSIKDSRPTVLYLVPQWWGAVNSAVRFAKVLRKQGWTMQFVLVKNFPFSSCEIFDQQLNEQKNYMIEQGFFCDCVSYRTDTKRPKMINQLALGRFFCKAMDNFQDDVSSLIEQHSPHLMLFHQAAFVGTLAAAKLEIPYVMISSSFCGTKNDQRPPADSPLIPSHHHQLRKLQILKAWLECTLKSISSSLLFPSLLIVKNYLKRSMIKVGAELLAGDFFSGLIPKCPIFYLMPSALDFTPVKGHHYLGDNIDLSEIREFSLEQFSDDKPLIYCSLGSMSHEWQSSKRFFKIFLEIAQQHNQYNFVLHIGGETTPEELGTIPDNVYVSQWVDQLAVLKKSSLMITHGGTNTLRECIALGVPMIVLPAHWDHFGSGARVVYHGLGVRGNLKKIKSRELLEMLDKVLNTPSYLDNVKKLQAEFLNCSTKKVALEALEKMALISRT